MTPITGHRHTTQWSGDLGRGPGASDSTLATANQAPNVAMPRLGHGHFKDKISSGLSKNTSVFESHRYSFCKMKAIGNNSHYSQVQVGPLQFFNEG